MTGKSKCFQGDVFNLVLLTLVHRKNPVPGFFALSVVHDVAERSGPIIKQRIWLSRSLYSLLDHWSGISERIGMGSSEIRQLDISSQDHHVARLGSPLLLPMHILSGKLPTFATRRLAWHCLARGIGGES